MSQRKCRVLVVEDEPAMREVLQARIEQWGFTVRVASQVRTAREIVSTFDPHVVISDLVLPDATGLTLLESLRAQNEERTILLITAYGTIDTAVQAMKAGAAEFMTKPLDYVALRRQLEQVEERLQSQTPEELTSEEELPEMSGMIGQSAALQRMQKQIESASQSDSPVLIVGESGSGKELVARTIHELSARKQRTFVAINTAAIPENLVEAEFFGVEKGAFTGAHQARAGLFEEAHRGTLFLDEVTEMPLALQAKFLRVLEDGHVRRVGGRAEMACDTRIISATNRDPAQTVRDRKFREDLFYRLDVLRIVVPPLRERKEDIPALAQHFLRLSRGKQKSPLPQLSAGAIELLQKHDWPGNVRELRNVMERAWNACQGEPISPEHIQIDPALSSASPSKPAPYLGIVIPHGVTAAEAERILILETLKATGNNKAETARRLGLDVKTIRNKLKLFEPGGDSPE